MKKKVRVGILLDEYRIPAWAHHMLSRIAASDAAEIVLVVRNDAARRPASGARKSIRRRWKEIPAILVRRIVRSANDRIMERGRLPDNAFAPIDASGLLEDVPELVVQPEQKKYSDYVEDADLARIAEFDVDVFVRLGFRVLRGGILTAARLGVWSYHHGDNRVNRGGPAGFWETMESWPETGTILQILTEDLDGGTVLYRTWACTNDRSVMQNNSRRYWTAAAILPRMIERLAAVGEERFLSEVRRLNNVPAFYSNRLYTKPSSQQFARLLLRKALEKGKRKFFNYFYFEQWCLLLDLREDLATSMRRFKRIVPPRDRFWADPNVFCVNDSRYVFLEEFIYATGKGHIAVARVHSDGSFDEPVPVIEENHHLSYPFVFAFRGETYMMAEACASKAVPLYRCVEFPHKWVLERSLFEGMTAVDPTLLFHRGKWFLFLGIAENPGSSSWDELFLFFSDDPVSGSWVAHPLNPIVSDVKCARPGGPILERNGALFRPAQNCSRRYGYGINIMEIFEMSETDYVERPAASIEPNWSKDILGVHTLSYAEGLTLADASVRRGKYW